MGLQKSKLILALVLITIILCGCSDKKTDISVQSDDDEIIFQIQDSSNENINTVSDEKTNNYENTLSSMSPEAKVGQLFFIRPEQLIEDYISNDDSVVSDEGEGVTFVSDKMRINYSEYSVGGFVLFAKNIDTPEQLLSFTHDLKTIGEINALIAVDEEGGTVTRLAQNKYFDLPYIDTMENIGLSGDVTNAYNAGDVIGKYLSDYGIMWDFAPVADLNTNPENIVIGSRSFGSDPESSSEMARSFIEGLHSHGVKSTLKHFPGHGDTSEDTHSGYVCVDKTWEELISTEIVPFKENLAITDAVMIAHINLPEVTHDDVPCSMSYEIITEKLREELGFDGVVICDSLAMGAVTDEYLASEAAVRAFEAGCDVLLTPQNFYEAYNGVLNAVKSGEITQERLDESVRRILELKEVF